MYTEKILIVDDEKLLCLAMRVQLIQDGYTSVDVAYSGEEATEKAKLTKYDIVFLDIVLPGINGIKTSTLIKDISSTTKIIFMSGHVSAELIKTDLKRAIKGEQVIFLYKPFKKDDISEIINGLLKEKNFVYAAL